MSYQTLLPLDYSSRSQADETPFKKVKEVNFEVLKKLTDKEYSYLIRMALAGKSDSKYPTSETGITLYKVAEAAGVDVNKIDMNASRYFCLPASGVCLLFMM